MDEIIALILAIVPGIEAMWSSTYLICSNAINLIPFSILINFVGVVIFITIIDNFGLPKKLEHFLVKRAGNRISKFEKWFARYGYIILLLLVGLPLTGVGSYTGAFIGRTLGLRKHTLYIAVFLGIVISAMFAFLLAFGIDLIGVKCPQ
jgi:uncharacterized membrane protein